VKHYNDLLSNIQKPLGIHHIRTILFSLPVNYLKDLRDFGLDKGGVDPFSPKYRLSSIICDVASFRLFKPVRSEPLHDNNRKFLWLARISSLSNEVGLYVALLEVLLFMPNSLIRHSK
jgi:hypothetical protein